MKPKQKAFIKRMEQKAWAVCLKHPGQWMVISIHLSPEEATFQGGWVNHHKGKTKVVEGFWVEK